jgi:pimeloyl-ACP methyl ester carboxylesterase
VIWVVIPAAIVLAALAYQRVGMVRDRRHYPPPGQIIDVEGAKLHLNVLGQGTPPVVLESGIGASSLSWAVVHPRLAEFTRVVSYDRAGLGWSAASRVPRTVPGMVDELRSALLQAAVAGPYILVGHSFGGLLVRAHAALYPQEVCGIVLVDPVHIVGWADCPQAEAKRLQLGVRLCYRGAWAARFGFVRAALATLVKGRNWFPKLAARVGGRRGTAALSNLVGEVRKLPPEYWPAVRAHWSDPKCFVALAGYLGCLRDAARYATQLPQTRGIPTIILSASTARPEELDERDSWTVGDALSKHVIVPDSGHWLHLDHPDLVVNAVRELLQSTKPLGGVPSRGLGTKSKESG